MTRTAGVTGLTCPDCGDTMQHDRVDHSSLRTSGPMIVEQMPAFVCPQCGYTAIPAATWEALDRLAAERPVPARFISVPVYDLSDLPGAEALLAPMKRD